MKKGISLATLSIVILLMIILTTTITATGAFALNNSKKIKFASEIALVQEMVDEYENKKSGEYPTSSIITVDLTNVSANGIIQFDDEMKNGSEITLYEVDFSLLGKNDLLYGNRKNADATDVYAVSKQTGKVYYVKGLKIGSSIYYTLNEELKSSINYSSNMNAITKDGIIFDIATSKWTNKNINSSIKVPNSAEYENVTVSVLQNNNIININLSETRKGYNIYNITNINGNYEVAVNYNKASNSNVQTFSVSNFDNTPPKFTVNKTQTLINEADNVKKSYIKVNIEHDISGIKYAKYETDIIDESIAKQYFSSNGIAFENEAFTVDRYTKNITIYVEDKAGNYSIQTVALDSAASYSDYIKSGISVILDGKNNTISGHSNNSDIWKDLSVNKFNCKIIGDALLNQDNIHFDGIDDYVEISQINYPMSSLEVVFAPENLNGIRSIFGNLQLGGSNIYIDNGYLCTSYYINEEYKELKSDTQLQAGKKYCVSTSYDGKVIKLYINGNIDNSMDIEGIINNPKDGGSLAIGANVSSIRVDNFFNGSVYSARYYNRALSQNEINRNYYIDKIRFGI